MGEACPWKCHWTGEGRCIGYLTGRRCRVTFFSVLCFSLCKSWKPLVHTLKEQKKALSKEK
jgi:hypothetical protein